MTTTSDKHVLIIGGGPAGILSAATFAKLGFKVSVFEKRAPPDPGRDILHNFVIVLNPKGLGAIRSVGIDTSHTEKFPLLACVRHSPDGRYSQPFLRPKVNAASNFERSELTQWLQKEVARLYPSIKWNFQWACTGIDFSTRAASFVDAKGSGKKSVKYDFLVGADGAHSVVREQLSSVELLDVETKEAPLVYKRFHHFTCDIDLSSKYGVRGPDGQVSQGAVLNFYPVTVPSAKKGQPKWGFVTLVNHEGGYFSGGLSVYTSVQHLFNTVGDYEHAIRMLPLPEALRKKLAQTLHSAPWSWGGTWVKCSQLHGPSCVLLGDAAHSVTPSLGQGCNCGLEDVTVLQQQLAALVESGQLIPPPSKESKRSGSTPSTPPTLSPMASPFKPSPAVAAAAAAGAAAASAAAAASSAAVKAVPSPSNKKLANTAAQAHTAATPPGSPARITTTTTTQAATSPAPKASPAAPPTKGSTTSAPSIPSGLDSLPAAFTAARLDDVHALVWLDQHARAMRGQHGVFNRHFWMYLSHMHLRPVAHALVPFGLVERPALQQVWEGPCAYTHIAAQLKWDGFLLGLAGITTVTAAAAAAAVYLTRKK